MQCADCPIVTKSKYNLFSHWKSTHGFAGRHAIAQFHCDDCAQAYTRREHFKHHLMAKHSPALTPHACDECGKVAFRRDVLVAHWRQMHGPKSLSLSQKGEAKICDLCSQVLKGTRSVFLHLLTKHQFWPFELRCDECSLEFRSRESKQGLAKHWRSRHAKTGPPQQRAHLTCDECLKTLGLGTKLNLTNHWLRIHAGQAEELNRKHKAAYAKRPPLTCDNCGAAYKNRGHFYRHTFDCRDEAGPPQSQCDECHHKFASKNVLSIHVQRMHKGRQKRVTCDDCRKSLASKRNFFLRHWAPAHLQIPRIRRQPKPMTCDDCGFATGCRGSFLNHACM